jgi:hypothetical protein
VRPPPTATGASAMALVGAPNPSRCQTNSAQIRQSQPDSGFGFKVKVRKTFSGVPFWGLTGGALHGPAAVALVGQFALDKRLRWPSVSI